MRSVGQIQGDFAELSHLALQYPSCCQLLFPRCLLAHCKRAVLLSCIALSCCVTKPSGDCNRTLNYCAEGTHKHGRLHFVTVTDKFVAGHVARIVFVSAEQRLWSTACSTAASGFPGYRYDEVVQLPGDLRLVGYTSRDPFRVVERGRCCVQVAEMH